MQYKVIDNFLPSDVFSKVQELMLGTVFPWYYNNGVVKTIDNTVVSYDGAFQFTHVFYSDFKPNSEYFNAIMPILERLQPASILRIKANLLTRESSIVEHGFHSDIPDLKMPCKTAVFYINTNNGYTLFEDGTKVDSVENRLLTFDSNMLHTGSSCTDCQIRCVINFNYYETTL
jgi:hypothetical protein